MNSSTDNEPGPDQRRADPGLEMLRRVKRAVAQIECPGRLRVGDHRPAGQEPPKERGVVVDLIGFGERPGQAGNQHLPHVMPGQAGPDAEHGIDQQQFALPERPSAPAPARHQAVDARQHDQNKDAVEKQGNRRRMRRVADNLHLDDPVGIERDEQQAEKNGAKRDGAGRGQFRQ